MRIGRWLARIVGGLVAVLAVAALADVATYDKQAWSADFERLKVDMAQGYANLDWIAEHRRLDLPGLSRRTAADLDGAHSRVRAYLALQRFVDRFGDPHLQMAEQQDSGPKPAAAAQAPPRDPPASDCAGAGYQEGNHGFRFPVERLPGWRPLAAGNFPTGLSGATGILRLAEFGENQYLSACTARFRPGIGERALQLAVRASLQAELRARLAQLRRAGAKRLLVDLSRNGGGSEWVNEAVPLFTAGRSSVRRRGGSARLATAAASGRETGRPARSSPRPARRCGSPARVTGRARCSSWSTAIPLRPRRISSPG